MIPGNVHAEEVLFILGPFGYTTAGGAVPARLVPEFTGEAALYLGIEKLQHPANVALLFQIDIGTANSADVLKTLRNAVELLEQQPLERPGCHSSPE